jgi:hypothetical protein
MEDAIEHFKDCRTRLAEACAEFEEADQFLERASQFAPIDEQEAADDRDAVAARELARAVMDGCADALYVAAKNAWDNHGYEAAHDWLAECEESYLEDKAYRENAVRAKDLERAANVAAGNGWMYEQGRGLPDEVDEVRIARGTLVWQ